MNKQLRFAGFIIVLGLVLSLGYWQQQGWAAGQVGNGLKQAGKKLKQLFSPTPVSQAFNSTPRPAPAKLFATITVTNLGDGPPTPANCPHATNCRLRDAIAKAAPGDTIDFAVAGTITLTYDYLVIAKSLTINGPGAAQLTISGNQSLQIFLNSNGNTLAINDLTIANGRTNFSGAGIFNNGTMTLTNSAVTGNTVGGGIGNLGNLTISNCTISGNSSTGSGGGIDSQGVLLISNSTISSNSTTNNPGGGIRNVGSMTITDSTISGNSAGNSGGGIYNFNSGSSATIIGSTISGNSADGNGGGIDNNGTVSITNSTLSGNSASSGGGLANSANSTLSNCTLANNTVPGWGGGIYSSAGTVNTRNTLIGGNTAAAQGPDVSGTLNSQGYNLIGNTANATITGDTTGNILNVNPLLGPLANYGGPFNTRSLLPGSPAIDAGDNCVTQVAGCLAAPLTTDQRGPGFNRQVGGSVDIGAFESRGFTLAIASGDNQSATAFLAFAAPLAVTVTATGAGEPVEGGRITFTPPPSGASVTLTGNPASVSGGTATSGTLTANAVAGTYNVQAGAPGITPVSFSLTNLNLNCPAITVGTPAAGVFSQSYSSSVAALPMAPAGFSYQYTLANATALPAGLTLDTNTGAITGTPTVPGLVSFDIRAEWFAGNTATGCAVTQTRGINVTCATVVTNSNDNGAGSLRATLATACAGSTITFASGVNLITLTSGELLINKDLTITGPGAGGLTISGNQASRVFKITGVTIVFNGLTIANGRSDFGGGIYSEGNVTISNSTLSGNVATTDGGGVYSFFGVVTVTDSTFQGNAATRFGGGLYNFAGVMTITGSTLSGNSATDGTGGGIQNNATLTVTNSTFTGNSSVNGGGMRNDNGTATLTNCTFAGNTAGAGGGIYALTGTVNVRNTLIAGNTQSFGGPDFQGTLNSQGYNLIGNTAATTIIGDTTGNLLNVNPLLAPLANYGGPTQTYALLPGSPAINGGTSTGAPATDQRGVARPQQTAVDIGAFESRGFTLAIASGNNQSTLRSGTFTNPLAVTVTANEAGEPINGGRVTFTPPGSGASATLAGNPATISAGSSGAATSGTVTANAVAGSYTVQAGGPGFTPVSFSLTNNDCQTITVTNPNTSTGTVGTSFNQSFTQTGGAGTVTFSLNSGTLPNGLTLNINGTLSGTPRQSGTFPLTIKATDSNNCSNTGATFSLVISCPVFTLGTPTATVAFGQSYSSSVAATPAAPAGSSYQYTLANGTTLPAGLTLDFFTGAITGTPTAQGVVSFDIRVEFITDNSATGCVVTQTRSINITCPSLVVMNGNDSGAGSLSEALDLVCPGGTITFASGVSVVTLVGAEISKNLTIQGPGASQLTISSNQLGPVFVINSGATVVLNGLTIANGDNPRGGGIFNDGTLTVINSALTGNVATIEGGGIYNNGSLTVTGSTLSGNSASGGGFNSGGGILNNGTATLINSTVSGNSSSFGGGGIFSGGTLTLTNCTITGNAASIVGGGIVSVANSGTVSARNTLIAGNTSPPLAAPDFSGPLTSLGYNLIGNTDAIDIIGDTTGNLLNVAPLLGPLANNGGTTQTHALLSGSPAINAGNNCVTQTPGCLATPLTTDQRGTGFNRLSGNAVDIGAFELVIVNTAPSFTPASALSHQQGSTAGAAVTVGTVADAQTAAGLLTVTQIAGGNATGITVTGITNTNGAITAIVTAGCTANSGTVRFQVSDGSLTGTGDLTVNVTANTAPVFGYDSPQGVSGGGSVTVTPSAGPGDNGGIASIVLQSQGTYAGTISVNASGVVSISNAAPVGSHTITIRATDNCGATTDGTFTLNVNNTAPAFTPAAAISRQQGSTAGGAVTVGTVADAQTAAGLLTVTQIAGGTATDITVSGITNTAGTITAVLTASCAAVGGTVRFQVSDGSLTGTGDLMVNVTANTAPTLTYTAASASAGGSTTNSPATATDNGSITGYAVQSPGSYTGTLSVNPSTGIVSISAAAPVGNHTITIRATDNCGATTDATFTLTVGNNAPTITAAAALTRQRGSAGSASTIATVSDSETPAGNLVVTATTVPAGITVTSITNTAGTIAANVAAGCTAALGNSSVVLTVTDGNSGTATANLTVTVTANAAPTLTYNEASVIAGSATTVNTATATDNGSINGYSIVSVVPALTAAPTVNASGAVSITNAGPSGNHVITVQATDNCGATTNASFTLTVNCSGVTVNPESLGGASTGASFSQTFTQTGGNGAITWSLTGTTPPGLGFNATTATLSGAPTQGGSYSFTIRATEANGCFGERQYTLGVDCAAIVVSPTSSSLPGGTAGSPYSQNFTAAGGASPYGFTVSAGSLPAGLMLDSGGLLAGTPSVFGDFSFTVRATDTNGCFGERAYTLRLCGAISLTETLPAGTIGINYNQTITASGGSSPYSFAVTGGTLPPGVSLSNGSLSGLPTNSGSFNFTVTATDNLGCTGAQSYTVTINCPTVTITQTSLPNGAVGTAYNQNLTATGGTAPYAFTVSSGALPGGIMLALSGALTGTPAASGTFNFTIRATDANGCFGEQAFTVQISGGAGGGLQFYPLPQPVRLLETRAGFSGCTNPGNPVNANGTFTLPAQGGCTGIPANAAAVTGNITVVPSGAGYLTLFPSSASQPTVANSNFADGEVTNNVFTVGLGAGDGAFKIFSSAATHVIVDVTGYYAPPGTAGLYFHPLSTPVRLLETRAGFNGCIAPGAPLTGTGNPDADPGLDFPVQGRTPVASPCNSIPASAQVLVGNATSVFPSGGGYLTIYPSGGARPNVASSNYAGSDVINGPFSVKLGPDGRFKVYTFATTDLVIDILGYYSEEAVDVNGPGLLFNPLPSPVRLLETRPDFPGFPLSGCTRTNAKIAGNPAMATHTQQAAGFCGLPASAQAVVGNVSVVNSAGAGFLTLFPGNLTAAPLVATSNYPAPATFGYNRHYFVGLSAVDGTFKVLTQFTTDLILDASGYFAP